MQQQANQAYHMTCNIRLDTKSRQSNSYSQQALVDVLDQNIRENTGMRETKFWHKTSMMFLHKAL